MGGALAGGAGRQDRSRVYGGLGSHGYVGFLVAFNAPKLLFLLMPENAGDDEWKMKLYCLLTPLLVLVLPCGALLWGHGLGTVGDLRGHGLVAGVVVLITQTHHNHHTHY